MNDYVRKRITDVRCETKTSSQDNIHITYPIRNDKRRRFRELKITFFISFTIVSTVAIRMKIFDWNTSDSLSKDDVVSISVRE